MFLFVVGKRLSVIWKLMMSFVARRVRIGALVGGVTAILAGGSARATQFVVADATYTHSAQTTTDSHYRVVPASGTPANWVSPVDYSNGSAHVRLEVKTKPNLTTETCFQVCFEATQNYGCTDISKPYTTLGIYEWDTPFSRFYMPGPVPWEKGILKVALLLKDTKNVKPAPENVGAATSALYMPTDVRVTVTIVSVGSTFQPPPGTGAVDAGLPDAVQAADAGVVEVGVGSRDDAAATDSTLETAPSPPVGGDDAALSQDAQAPSPDSDAGTTGAPPPPSGSGGGAGSNVPPVGPDAAPVSSNPPSVSPDAAPATPPMSGGQGGAKGSPSVGGSNVTSAGCRVSTGNSPADLRGFVCGFALVLVARLRRRSSSLPVP